MPKQPAISRGLRRYHASRRENARQEAEARAQANLVRPADLRALEHSGTVAPSLTVFVERASFELAVLLQGLGGLDQVSEQRRLLAEDYARLGVVLRGELARYVQRHDPDAAGRVATLANARRSTLSTLGLARFERDALAVDGYEAAIRQAADEEGPVR